MSSGPGLLTALRELLPAARPIVTEGSGNVPDQKTLAGRPDDVRRAIAALPNTTDLFPTRDSYRDVGYAIKAALPRRPDEAYDLFSQWAARWPGDENTPLGNDPGVVASDWARMKPPFKRGASWLYELAAKHGGFDVARVWFEEVGMGDEPDTSAFDQAGKPALAEPIRWIDPREWHGVPRPERRWIVRDVIPDGEVTMITGKGGVGKTLLAQQGATCVARGLPWLGRETVACKVMMFLCEDPEDELHARQIDINAGLVLDMVDLSANLRIASRKYMDNLLALWDRNVGEMKRTTVFDRLLADAQAFGAKLVFVDTAADTFGGEENNRSQVRQFIQSCLGRLAKALDGAVVLLAHPSRAGEASGEGTSGSTAWHGSVRSRLYLDYATKDGRGDMRRLVNMKANYAAKGDEWRLRWAKGTFEVVSATSLNASELAPHIPTTESEIERLVLVAIAELATEGKALSTASNSSNRVGVVLPQRFRELGSYGRERIEETVFDLIRQGRVKEGIVGRKASRHPVLGLVVSDKMSGGIFD